MRIFIMTGSMLGILGAVLGVVLGLLLTINLNIIVKSIQTILGAQLFNPEIYFLSTLPHKINTYEVCFIALLSIILSVLATIYPALRAARLDPVVIIRDK
jgi:lipoprotein-releasing system permease protein